MNAISRASSVVLHPRSLWRTIASEPATPLSLLGGYVLPLAAIGPVALAISRVAFGTTLFFIPYHESPTVIAIGSLTSYAVTIVLVVLLAVAIHLLAPAFGARPSFVRALKIAAYAFTPSYLAGAALVVPSFVGFIATIAALFGGCYAVVLLFLGLPPVMGTTGERAPLYTLAVFGCGLVCALVLAGVSFRVNASAIAMTGGSATLASLASGQSSDAGGAASAAAGASALKALVGGNKTVSIVPRERLAALLPASLDEMTRSGGDSRASEVAGLAGSSASAEFAGAAGTIAIVVADLGNASGLATLASTAAGLVQSTTDDGYEKNVVVNGVRVHETWRRATKHSEILSVVGGRFSITVDGDGVGMDAAERAFATIDLGRLNDLAASAK